MVKTKEELKIESKKIKANILLDSLKLTVRGMEGSHCQHDDVNMIIEDLRGLL